MNPIFNVYLGGSIACMAIFLGTLKLARPASPWHRRLGRLTAILSLGLLGAMVSRTLIYQVAFSLSGWVHMVVGGLAFLCLVVKILVAWRKIPFPGWLRPLGYLLVLTFPLAGLGKTIPFLKAAMEWQPLAVEDVMRDADSPAFDRDCLRCHNRDTATEGLGRRRPERWIKIVQPMAWAGNLSRENTRGALASLLVKPVAKNPEDIASSPLAPGPATAPTAIYCVACHNQKRIFKAKKNEEEWRKTVSRMMAHSREMPDVKPIASESAELVLRFLAEPRP